MLATRRAMGREIFKYYAAFLGFTAVALATKVLITKKYALLYPLLPLSIMLGFQYDLSYGSMMSRAQIGAFEIIKDEPLMLYPPWNNGIMSPAEYDSSIPYSLVSSPFNSVFE
jgi:hypothetical protein